MPPNLNQMPEPMHSPEDAGVTSAIQDRMKEVIQTVSRPEDNVNETTIKGALRRALNAETKKSAAATAEEIAGGSEDIVLVNALIAQLEEEAAGNATLVERDGVVVNLKRWKEERGL